MMEQDMRDMQLEESDDEGLEFEPIVAVPLDAAYSMCAVGTFITSKQYNFNVMKNRMAIVWQPGRGISIEDLGNRLVLFRFYSKIDLRWVLDNGPWTFDDYLLVLHEMKEGEDPTRVPLHQAAFWVQIHNLGSGFFSESIGRALGNYIGTYVAYDTKNAYSFVNHFMRIRVLLDVTEPLKKGKKVRNPGSPWTMSNFKYERLPTFCYCGKIGHLDRLCEIRFQNPDVEPIRRWNAEIRAPPKKSSRLGGERWLVETAKDNDETYKGDSSAIVCVPQLPPNLLALHGNYAANAQNKGKLLLTCEDEAVADQEGLVVGDEKKRPRTAMEATNGQETSGTDDMITSPSKLSKGTQARLTNLARADLNTRFCQEK
ncbi:hypothetical protein LINPERPRIM_LOCUS5673 [Linum perenne]